MSGPRDIVLVAASGLAREVLSVLEGHPDVRPVAFLDDDPRLWGTQVGGVPVMGSLGEAELWLGARFVVCTGAGPARAAIVERLTAVGVASSDYATVVDPSVRIPSSVHLGLGSVVLSHVSFTADVRVGRHVVVMPGATLTHDDAVCDYATVCAGVALGGGVRVGRGAYLGMNASVRQDLTVGDGAVLGMGSVLLQNLPPEETWAGNPAHRLEREHAEAVGPRRGAWRLGTGRAVARDQVA